MGKHEKKSGTQYVRVGQDQSKEREKKKRKNRLLKVLVFILMVILLLLLLHRCYGGKKPSSGIEQGIIDLPDQVDAQKLVNDAVEEGMFQVFMNTAITVDADGYADLLIQNSVNNHYSAYVEIHSGDTLLYRSEVIDPGYKLERDTLRKDLEPGTYECEATFYVVDTETEAQINTIGLSIQIKKEM